MSKRSVIQAAKLKELRAGIRRIVKLANDAKNWEISIAAQALLAPAYTLNYERCGETGMRICFSCYMVSAPGSPQCSGCGLPFGRVYPPT